MNGDDRLEPGFKVLHEKRMRGFDQPVIVVSAAANADNDVKVRRLGAEALFAKPVCSSALIETIDELMQR